MRLLSPALLLLTLAAGPAADDAWIPLAPDLRLRPLAENVWLHESDTLWGDSRVAANGLVVRGADGAIVVDTPWNDEQTARLLDWITQELGAPVLAVVTTHFHPDAAGGIAEVERRGIPAWGSALTAPLAAANDRPPPSRTFDREATLSTGSEELELLYLGPSHSVDDVVVWLPERRLLYGGCAVKAAAFESLGFIGDADLASWPAALRAMEALAAETVVPGHGAPGGPELIGHTLYLVREQELAAEAAH